MFFPFHDDNPTRRTPVVTIALIGVNVVSLLWVGQLGAPQRRSLELHWGFIPARVAQLTDPKPIEVPAGEFVLDPWTGRIVAERTMVLKPEPGKILLSLVTCMFLHANWMHLIGNMWFLWIFGNNVEDRLGSPLFLVFYLFGGLLASGAHWLANPSSAAPVIGASGAVAAVLGAYAITWPWARVHTLLFLFIFITVIDVPALLVLGVWFLGQLLSVKGELAQGVAWWAHIGGFAAGALLMPLLDMVSHGSSRATQD